MQARFFALLRMTNHEEGSGDFGRCSNPASTENGVEKTACVGVDEVLLGSALTKKRNWLLLSEQPQNPVDHSSKQATRQP